ncbi:MULTISPECIES: hypothetical protein [unclassified Halomonas]|uniref:hypothetical protein n=1 Tax=unclassified Halomonas TaxID=2609666 RepID=UPI001C97A2A7|nr:MULTISPECIES: hypothetical protein [unclassified Halomonas]MBY5927467.1 hypothetical protein [Halomonas sp. DP4Y7-2]MBY6234507.1 hypothetical protein [Halomonas sp. DP4Y7-1]
MQKPGGHYTRSNEKITDRQQAIISMVDAFTEVQRKLGGTLCTATVVAGGQRCDVVKPKLQQQRDSPGHADKAARDQPDNTYN